MSDATFTEGPITPHLLRMAGASAVGMLAVFAVALVDIYLLSLLGDVNVLAAVGFASTLLFFTQSLGIGFSVATGVLMAQHLSRHGRAAASDLLGAILLLASLLSVFLALLLWPLLPTLLHWLGAEEQIQSLALHYLAILLPSMPLMTLVMTFSAALRGAAQARLSMHVTLIGAVVNLILDPLFIFVLDGGMAGAAWATVVCRLAMVLLGLWYLHQHALLGSCTLNNLHQQRGAILRLVTPNLITNLATPIGGAIVTAVIARFGAEAVAGNTLVGSITPLLFVVFFALSGATGPIIGQNIGAGRLDRVEECLNSGLRLMAAYTLLIWLLLWLTDDWLVWAYRAQGESAIMLYAFCHWMVPLSGFLGVLALASSIFNNLERPFWSSALSVSRATLGTLLFALLGAYWGGASGVIIGNSATFLVWGIAALLLARHRLRQAQQQRQAQCG